MSLPPKIALRNPGELGKAPTMTSIESNVSQQHQPHPNLLQAARERRKALKNFHNTPEIEYNQETTTGSLVTSFHHRGMEILVVCHETELFVCDARTRLVLQRETLPSNILRLHSNPVTGQIVAITESFVLASFHPKESNHKLVSYGTFQWHLETTTTTTAETFFFDTRIITSEVFVVMDNYMRIFMAHLDQLVVVHKGNMLWATRLGGPCQGLDVSGDGRAIAALVNNQIVILEQEDEKEDDLLHYRPGPSLEHESPVIFISFRGLGHVTSKIKNKQTNDLLLTHCENGQAKIFGQNGWAPLTDWVTPPSTVLTWVRGITAFTIGDLELPPPKTSEGSSATTIPHHMSCISNAGAWLTEITFQGAFPALRLSRLTYLRRGTDETHPTLFESVSSFLPAKCLWKGIADSSRNSLVVEGIWPAWNPSNTQPSRLDSNETLRGSAMAFLGISNMSSGNAGGYFGDAFLGDTQTPPVELRITASHPIQGCATIMEFPFVTDGETTNSLELGDPVRSIVSLGDMHPSKDSTCPTTCRDFEGGKLLAKAEGDNITIVYRKAGTPSLIPSHFLPEDVDDATTILKDCRRMTDESLQPAPLRLPTIPLNAGGSTVTELLWWPDDGLGGPPKLLCFLDSGEGLLLTIPSPRDVFELPVPGFEDFIPLTSPSGVAAQSDTSDLYEVLITPHPEYGLGLRLESQSRRRSAVAGSFKRHPITGESLPAEDTGVIMVGDELVGANDEQLEDKEFDEIIKAVRDVGVNSGPQNPVRMVFRRSVKNRLSQTSPRSSEDHRKIFNFNDEKGENLTGASIERKGSLATSPLLFGSFRSDIGRMRLGPTCRRFLSRQGDTKRYLVHLCEKSLIIDEFDAGEEGEVSVTRVDEIVVSGESLRDFDVTTLHQGAEECILVCDQLSRVYTVHISIRDNPGQTSKRINHAFTIPNPEEVNVSIRAYSPQLIATMLADKKRDSIRIWTPRLHPGGEAAGSTETGTGNSSDYNCQEIRVDVSSVASLKNRFVDFAFVGTGFLDNFPSLLVFSLETVVRYQREGGKSEWTPNLHLSFCDRFAAEVLGEIGSYQRRAVDFLPHILSSIQLVHNYTDEDEVILSDWSPEALIADMCTDPAGVDSAFRSRIRPVFSWLVSEGLNISEDVLEGPLLVSPVTASKGRKDDRAYGFDASEDSSDDFAGSLRSLFQSILLRAGVTLEGGVPTSQGNESPIELPPVLLRLKAEDLCILWSMGDTLLDLPDLGALDTPGQLAMYSHLLLNRLKKLSPATKVGPQPISQVLSSLARVATPPTIGQRKTPNSPSCSSSCLASLISEKQGLLLELCKRGNDLSWNFVKEHRVPFWLRSDSALRKVSEDVGQAMFRETRDILECSLFFIIAGKLRTLRNLAATDQSESGRKFFKFISEHDFTSERGRRAAEKNAFSLLRKNRYRVAASFFLLASPPFLKAALETLVTKLQDYDLAFMVSRLMETSPSDTGASSLLSNPLGGFGGGGGYAGGGMSQPEFNDSMPDESFADWNPTLGPFANNLLVERIIPKLSADHILCAVAMLWLGKRDEASWWCTGLLETSFETESGYRVLPNCLLRGKAHKFSADDTTLKRAARILNKQLDCSVVPLLLRYLGVEERVLCASKFIVASQLLSRGIDLSSIRVLEVNGLETTTKNLNSSGTDKGPISGENPSKVGPYDSQRRTKNSATVPLSSGTPPSSIFDDFDVSVQNRQNSTTSGGQNFPSSSIFDSFGVPTTSRPPAKDPPKDPSMESSIFDSFDVPKSVPKQSAAVSNDSMESSIFDSFGPPPPRSKETSSKPVDAESSSIFDQFDVPQDARRRVTTDSTPKPASSDTSERKSEKQPSPERLALSISIDPQPIPTIWNEWIRSVELESASRRLLREIASVLAEIRSDIPDLSIDRFYSEEVSLLPTGASEVLQLHCDAEAISLRVRDSLSELSHIVHAPTHDIARMAARLIQNSGHRHRILFLIFLYIVTDQVDLAEKEIYDTSFNLIEQCTASPLALSDLVYQCKSRSFVASQFTRRIAARLSWQLEVCLWLHRGGCIPLEGSTLKIATLAVRIGFLVAGWSKHFYCLESMIRSDPDCRKDEELGRNVWSTSRLSNRSRESARGAKPPSGGWEFLVDCRRSEASTLLRGQPTGSFIIRPHQRDNGVFTLSFKTNLAPSTDEDVDDDILSPDTSGDELGEEAVQKTRQRASKKDDSVQHAVIRLSESGFRCGSFGPFTSLIDLLEAVSSSLPFPLRFDRPPENRAIQEEGRQPSPNAVFFRRLVLSHADSLASNAPGGRYDETYSRMQQTEQYADLSGLSNSERERLKGFGIFLELCVLSKLRTQFCSVASFEYEYHDESTSEDDPTVDVVDWSSHILSPFLKWCRSLEVQASEILAPPIHAFPDLPFIQQSFSGGSKTSFEEKEDIIINGGDSLLRMMIRKESGLEFTTLRLLDGGECTLVVLLRREDTIRWLMENGYEDTEEECMQRLKIMQKGRIIESIDLSQLPLKQKSASEAGIRYRFIDPWEVEAVTGHDGESKSVSIGRERFVGFSLGKVALSSETYFRTLGNLPCLELWTSVRGGITMTKALATARSPWERGGGGDLLVENGLMSEPSPMTNSIQEHLYRNALFRRMDLPQRYIGIVQVELLDLKNLTSPSGSLALSVYAILRLKRLGSNAKLTNKSRTLDTASTSTVRLGKSTGPNAPASWGSVVRFRFPLPEDVDIEGQSVDDDREALFRGHPSILQLTVYEKKLLVDSSLGSADIPADNLWAGGQVEEWVPLRSEKETITWFARVRLTLRFEMMCVVTDISSSDIDSVAPSAGLRKIQELGRSGGATSEDAEKRSQSSPDLVSMAFENFVY